MPTLRSCFDGSNHGNTMYMFVKVWMTDGNTFMVLSDCQFAFSVACGDFLAQHIEGADEEHVSSQQMKITGWVTFADSWTRSDFPGTAQNCKMGIQMS